MGFIPRGLVAEVCCISFNRYIEIDLLSDIVHVQHCAIEFGVGCGECGVWNVE